MWVFSEQGFYSVVEDWEDKGFVYVRSRWKRDLENLIRQDDCPTQPLQILSTPERDYPFRIHIAKDDWAEVLSAMAAKIGYGNFKGRISEIDSQRERLYLQVWSIMGRGAASK